MIVNDRNDLIEATSAAIVTIAKITTIPANIVKSMHSDSNGRKDRSDRVCPVILMIPAIIWKSILSNRDDLSDRVFSTIAMILAIVTTVNDHMEARLSLITSMDSVEIV